LRPGLAALVVGPRAGLAALVVGAEPLPAGGARPAGSGGSVVPTGPVGGATVGGPPGRPFPAGPSGHGGGAAGLSGTPFSPVTPRP
jgi:hypothetical protein